MLHLNVASSRVSKSVYTSQNDDSIPDGRKQVDVTSPVGIEILNGAGQGVHNHVPLLHLLNPDLVGIAARYIN